MSAGMTYRLRSFAWAGYIAGMFVGFGAASLAWLNPYLSVMLWLGGHVLFATALIAARTAGRAAIPSDALPNLTPPPGPVARDRA